MSTEETPVPPAPTPLKVEAAVAVVPPDSNGINRLIVTALVYSLGWLLVTETLIMLLSWWRPAADGPGVNVVHEVSKSAISFILGNLSAVVQAKLVGQGNHS